jgi:FixJ family two-component response regulator
MDRTLLLVDDEENVLNALTRLLRRDGYTILRAASGREGLQLLAEHPVGVIVSDERMPEMRGVEFLREAKKIRPDSIRIVLSGYTDLESVTQAINEGAVYKFFTKPWEDAQIQENIREAFQHHEMRKENQRLSQELIEAKRELEKRVDQKTQEALRNLRILQVSQEILEQLPVGVIGVGDDGCIAVVNARADRLLGGNGLLLGGDAQERLPATMLDAVQKVLHGQDSARGVDEGGLAFWCQPVGLSSSAEGAVLTFLPANEVCHAED